MREKDPAKLTAIFKATLSMVLREGFAGLKMSTVAKEAGVATGTLYVYFKDKDALINELYLHLKKESAGKFFEGYDASAPFMMCFERVWKNFVLAQLAQPEAAAFLEQYYRSPFLRDTVKEETDKLIQPIFDLLERGKSERLVKDVPTPLLAIQLSGSVGEFTRWHHSGQIQADDATLSTFFRLAWDSIKQ